MIIFFDRYDRTEFSATEALVVVKKFGKPTLEEEASGRIDHIVTISPKVLTRTLAKLPSLAKFSFKCSCRASKTFCIHVAIVILSDFTE